MKILTDSEKKITLGKLQNDQYILKSGNDFFKMEKKDFDELYDENRFVLQEEIKDNWLWALFMTLFILLTIMTYFMKEKYVIIDSNFLFANIVLFANIFIHEIGHIFALKLFYRSGKVKLGFKIIFIYPAFYVDTSDTYMLPKYKRIAVYLAGNFMNCIYLLLCMIFFPSLNEYNYIIISTVLINFLPIIKSDGYYALISLFGRYNSHQSKKRNFFEDTIRGLTMFLFLLLLSKVNIHM